MDNYKRSFWLWIGLSFLYGAFFRAAFSQRFAHYVDNLGTGFAYLLSFAFVILVPMAMGYLVIAKAESKRRIKWPLWIFLPWVPVLVGIAVAALMSWEGFICILLFTPIALVMSSLGGVTAGIIARNFRQTAVNLSVAFVLLLPLIISPIEARIPSPSEIRTVENKILIHASSQTIWQNIERVRLIQPNELPFSWNRAMGFPRPLEASLSHEGVGGVRHATFAGNVLFVETIDVWGPQQRLGFSIKADTADIPSTTLDEHVTIGGSYFDVLHGEYILEDRGNGDVVLRLVSKQRLSTHLNWYARLWSESIMSDIQRSILYVIKHRCEL